MYKCTTPTVKWTVNNEDINLEDISQLWMTFDDRQKHQITKDISDIEIDIEENTISYTLSQDDTLKLKPGIVEVQLRVLMNNGQAMATPIKSFTLDRVLKEGVIE